MSSDLTVVPVELRTMASALDGVRDGLTQLDDLVGSYADSVGDDALEARLRDLGDNWRRTREDLAEGARIMADWARQSANAYEGTDSTLGTGLQQGAAPRIRL